MPEMICPVHDDMALADLPFASCKGYVLGLLSCECKQHQLT